MRFDDVPEDSRGLKGMRMSQWQTMHAGQLAKLLSRSVFFFDRESLWSVFTVLILLASFFF